MLPWKWIYLALPICISPLASPVFAWGERGHDGVTRVAARILADDKDPEIARFGDFLQRKENMLGHLANVPDIVWRSISPEIDRFSSPSHYIDLDYVTAEGPLPSADSLPVDIKGYGKALEANCRGQSKSQDKKKGKAQGPNRCVAGESTADKIQKAGHAPFRIQALSQELTLRFRELKALESPSQAGRDQDSGAEKNGANVDAKNALVDRILLLSGVLSHFVGDLANPHHTTSDYDGWDTDQGGLHGYFEGEIVDSLGLDLEATVLDEAERHLPTLAIFTKYPHDSLRQAWALALDSYGYLPMLTNLDRDYALLAKSVPSHDKEQRQKAKRKAPAEVRNRFRNLIVLRLAAGADALSRLWLDAWQQGGKPDLSFYRSYHYDVKPDFIPLGYIEPNPPKG